MDPVAPRLPDAALAALEQGHTVEAIKLTRESLGLGLKEAKDLVDTHVAGQPHLKAQLAAAQASRGRGCLLLLSGLAALAAILYFAR